MIGGTHIKAGSTPAITLVQNASPLLPNCFVFWKFTFDIKFELI